MDLKAADPKDINVLELNKHLDFAKRKVFIGSNAIFLGTLLCQFPVVWSHQVSTSATDGRSILWNPTWFLKLPEETRPTVLLHELWHIGLLHMCRMEGRDPKIWNYAADIYINNMLEAKGYSFAGTRPWKKRDWDHMSTEELYDHILSLPNPHSLFPASSWGSEGTDPQADNSAPVWDDDDGDMVPDITEEAIAEQVQAVATANTQAELMGGGWNEGGEAGEVQRVLRQFLEPKVPWEKVVHDFMIEQCKTGEPNYKRPNRRFPDLILPSNEGEGRLTHLTFFMDTSGSVTDSMMVRLNSEAKHVWDVYQPEKLSMICFDTRIQTEKTFVEGEYYDNIEIAGRGGTSLTCVAEWIKTNKPTAVVILSDLECSPMEEIKDIPILWVCINNPTATVVAGKLIHIKE